MKKSGILHIELSKIIAGLAHEDYILIGDAGMPHWDDVPFVDLCLNRGTVGFIETLDTILGEMFVQDVIIDEDMEKVSPDIYKETNEMLKKHGDFDRDYMSNAQLQTVARKGARVVIRTGEHTPYANIILTAGCTYL